VTLARTAPALFVLLWATGFIGARYAMPYAEPFWFLFARFVIALALLAAIALVVRSRRPGARSALHAAFAGALIHGVYLGGVFWAIRNGMPAGLSALIIGLQPLLSAIMAGLFLGERVLARHWAGLAVGFAGLVVVLWPKIGEIGGGVTAATLGACLVAVLAISSGTIWQKRFVSDVDLIRGTIWQYVGGAIVAGIAALALEDGVYVPSGELYFAMAWLVLVLSIGAVFLLMYLIREGEVAKVASLFYLVPAVTAVMAWILFGETLTLVQILGMAIATAGVALATTQPPARDRASR
jgi:drug/metabolite transporter (DMT)-like permease